jgi:hypothetical protein
MKQKVKVTMAEKEREISHLQEEIKRLQKN